MCYVVLKDVVCISYGMVNFQWLEFDATDKIRFESLAVQAILVQNHPLKLAVITQTHMHTALFFY